MHNKFKGRALNTIVVVQETNLENKTKSGIDISGIVDANEKQKKGLVVSVGEFCPRIYGKGFWSRILSFFNNPYTIKEGDEVIFDKFKMTEFTQEGTAYILIDYRDIVLVY